MESDEERETDKPVDVGNDVGNSVKDSKGQVEHGSSEKTNVAAAFFLEK